MRGLLNCVIFHSLRVRVIVALVCAAMAIPLAGQTFTTLVQFDLNTDGAGPQYGALVQGRDGSLYGTTSGGTTNSGAGTVFKMTAGGTLTTIYSTVPTGAKTGKIAIATAGGTATGAGRFTLTP
jgi:uncharacterized repeat protein (TIGR03803 family)